MHVLAGVPLRDSGPPPADLDPALLAFIKWHVTSPLKWEALWYLADREGRWLGVEEMSKLLHVPRSAAQRVLAELAREGVLNERRTDGADEPSYLLPRHEPSTVVLHRLIESATQRQEVRSIVAAHLLAHRAD